MKFLGRFNVRPWGCEKNMKDDQVVNTGYVQVVDENGNPLSQVDVPMQPVIYKLCPFDGTMCFLLDCSVCYKTQGSWTSPRIEIENSFQSIAQEIAKIVEEKDSQYGDSFGKASDCMQILYPSGIPFDQIPNALYIVRILDKLCRIATGKADPEDPDVDIAGYSIKRIYKRRNDGK